MMALAIHLERMLRAGETTHAEIARRYGLSRTRVTQIENLANLAPEIQEGVLRQNLSNSERCRAHAGDSAFLDAPAILP